MFVAEGGLTDKELLRVTSLAIPDDLRRSVASSIRQIRIQACGGLYGSVDGDTVVANTFLAARNLEGSWNSFRLDLGELPPSLGPAEPVRMVGVLHTRFADAPCPSASDVQYIVRLPLVWVVASGDDWAGYVFTGAEIRRLAVVQDRDTRSP
jgi:hypothetical protein